MAGLLRGVIKALAVQDQIVMPHLIFQGVVSNILTYFFGFYLYPRDLYGIWIGKTIVSLLIIVSYIYVLYKCNWH